MSNNPDYKYWTPMPWYKKIPIIPTIILLLLLGAWVFRWNTVALKTYSDGVMKWERDRWTGQMWFRGYGISYGGTPIYKEKPINGSSSRRTVATIIWWIAFAADSGYIIYRIRKEP